MDLDVLKKRNIPIRQIPTVTGLTLYTRRKIPSHYAHMCVSKDALEAYLVCLKNKEYDVGWRKAITTLPAFKEAILVYYDPVVSPKGHCIAVKNKGRYLHMIDPLLRDGKMRVITKGPQSDLLLLGATYLLFR